MHSATVINEALKFLKFARAEINQRHTFENELPPVEMPAADVRVCQRGDLKFRSLRYGQFSGFEIQTLSWCGVIIWSSVAHWYKDSQNCPEDLLLSLRSAVCGTTACKSKSISGWVYEMYSTERDAIGVSEVLRYGATIVWEESWREQWHVL